MLATRYTNSSTTQNLSSLITLLNDPNCVEVRMFATGLAGSVGYSKSDGPDTNPPLVSAIAKYVIPGISDVYVLFDGVFLTAARRPRFLEVQQLMDTAQLSGKASFFPKAAPFTSATEPHVAVETLLALSPLTPFTQTTRAGYFSLLCDIPETEYP